MDKEKPLTNLKDLNQLNIKRYKAGYLPSLSGFITYQQVIQGDNILNNAVSSPTSIAGLKLNVPIFDSFHKKAQIQRVKLSLEAIEMKQELVKSGIDFSIQTAKHNFINAKTKSKLERKIWF